MNQIARKIGRRLAEYLSRPLPNYTRHDSASIELVLKTVEPGDIILIDGNSRISTAIKYLSQSTWSHACLYVGSPEPTVDSLSLVEADLKSGVARVPLSKYADYNLRICRAVGVSETEKAQLISFVEERLGHQYDLKNIIDLMRFLIQNPAVPPRYRRQLISFGSGEPTKAICSTLIAQAFQSIHYPILPNAAGSDEYEHRHFTHFVPRDFDLSPYFRIVKPTIEKGGFDFRGFSWKEAVENQTLEQKALNKAQDKSSPEHSKVDA